MSFPLRAISTSHSQMGLKMIYGPALVRRSRFASSTPSVLEESVDSFVKRKRLRELTRPPVPVAPGETLLYIGGASTRRSVLMAWISTSVCWTYLIGVKAVEFADPSLTLIGPGWSLIFASIGALTTAMALGTTRVMARYAVLTADGAHLRIYPYGSLAGAGVGEPVTVPLTLIKENATGRGARSDNDAMYVTINNSQAHVVFDKPVHLPLPRGPGSGLIWTDRGVAVGKGGLPKGAAAPVKDEPKGSASAEPSASLYLMTPADRDDLRRFAVLSYVLQDGVEGIDAGVVARGEWELDAMKEQLCRKGWGPREKAVQELALWRKAIDGDTGREYWYHEVSWARGWDAPTLDDETGAKKGPYEWHPHRAELPVPTVIKSPLPPPLK